jgi:hypothetical protein
VKTSLATTAWGGFAVGAMSLPGNPFDGHTLEEQLAQVERLTGMMPERCHVDRGYIVHHAVILELTGPSYRAEAAKARLPKEPMAAP